MDLKYKRSSFLIHDERKLIWCDNRIIWDFWFRLILYRIKFENADILGRHDLKSVAKLNNLMWHPIDRWKKIFDNFQNILFLMDPFERLIFAYKELFESCGEAPNLNCDIDLIKQLCTEIGGCNGRILQANRIRAPSFLNFMKIVTHWKWNMYWTPITKMCLPCQLKIQNLLRLECLETHLAQFLNDTLEMTLDEAPLSIRNYYTRYKISDQISKYFKDIPTYIIIELWRVYAYDIILFNYKFNDFDRAELKEIKRSNFITALNLL